MSPETPQRPSLFLSLTVILTLLFWIPLALQPNGSAGFSGQLLLFLGGAMPSAVALGLVFTTWPQDARRDFLWRSLTFRGVRPITLLILLIPILINAGAFVFYAALSRPPSLGLLFDAFANPRLYAPFILSRLAFGPLSQELGWRGYLLDPLRARFRKGRNRYMGDFWASIALGLIWGLWHIPLFFVIGTSQYEIQLFTLGWVGSILDYMLVSIIYTWQHHVTGRNILMAILYHFISTMSRTFILAGNDPLGPLWGILTLGLTTLMVFGLLVAPWGLEYDQTK